MPNLAFVLLMTSFVKTKFAPLFEYEIFLPSPNAKGHKVDIKRINLIKKEIIEFLGGLTDTKHKNKGAWKMGKVTIYDEIVIWKVITKPGRKESLFIRKIK